MQGATTTVRKLIFATIASAFAALALAGCITVQVPAGSATSDSGTNSSAASDSTTSSTDTTSSASTTGTSASSTATSSTSAPSGSTSVATGKQTKVTNNEPGYTFETDEGYSVEKQGNVTRVYTSAKSGQVPYFSVAVTKNTTGNTAENILNKTGNDAISKYGDRLIDGTPITNTIKISGRSVKGLEYGYTNDGGTGKNYVINYVDEINGYLFMWTGLYSDGDSETAAAMESAMKTAQIAAS